MERLIDGLRGTGDFQLPSSVYVGGRGAVPESKRALFEISGSVPVHLRATVQDRFDGTRWTTSPALEAARPDLRSLTAPAKSAQTKITFYTGMAERLPSPAGVREVSGIGAQARGGWVLASQGDVRGLSVELQGDESEALPPEVASDPELTALPDELKAELRPLAEQIVQGATSPREKVRAIERYFRENFEYALTTDLIGKGHPLTVLIKEKRPAYCVYFASAMAALLRTSSVPARLVGGFAVEGKNPLTGSAVVRERDAHAWVEVFLADEQRFAAFDPTPWQSREEALGLRSGIFGKLFEAVRIEFESLWATFRRSPGEVFRRIFASPILWGLVGLIVAWRLLRGLRSTRVRARGPAMSGTDPRLRALYGRYLKLLKARAQIAPAPSETDDEVLARLEEGRGEIARGAAAKFIGDYRLARYRGAALLTGALEASLEELEKTLR